MRQLRKMQMNSFDFVTLLDANTATQKLVVDCNLDALKAWQETNNHIEKVYQNITDKLNKMEAQIAAQNAAVKSTPESVL